jgi:type II secretory pathway component PulK
MDPIVRTFVAGALAPDWETPRLAEDNAFTRLAEDVRQGEVPHLKAGHLLPGDLVLVEGWVLRVADARRYAGLVALDFDLGGFVLIAPEDRLVEVVRLAATATCGLWL